MVCTNADVLKASKNIYRSAGKFDDQHHYKAILEAFMVSTLEKFTGNSKISSAISVPVKEPNASKYFRLFSETLDARPKTALYITKKS